MAPGPYERVLETLEDLDARLAGLEVGYSEPNATAAREHVAELADFFENDPDDLVALRDAVEELVETEDSAHALTAKEHADALKRQVRAQIDDEE
jgi:ketosteroid isomerase-like protein